MSISRLDVYRALTLQALVLLQDQREQEFSGEPVSISRHLLASVPGLLCPSGELQRQETGWGNTQLQSGERGLITWANFLQEKDACFPIDQKALQGVARHESSCRNSTAQEHSFLRQGVPSRKRL